MVRVEEASIVMIVHEDTKSIYVFKVTLLFIKSVLDVVHSLTTEDILNRVVHWIVEQCGQVILVWSNVGWVTVEALAHLEHASRLSVLAPEVLWNLRNGIDSNTIEAVSLYQILDPVLQLSSNPVVLLCKIWQTG